MSGKKTVPCTQEQYEQIINLTRDGVGTAIEPNPRIATALEVEANTGLRIGDVLRLRMADFIKDGNGGYRFNDLVEQKTRKIRSFYIPKDVHTFLKKYCERNGIDNDSRIFPISVRCVQKHLQKVTDYLGFEDISTHSFRKMFAGAAYVNSGYDIELVKELLQHSSTTTTSKYLRITNERMAGVLNKCVSLI